jgi:two-component system response regulator PilR (NtrC family)
MPKRTVLIVDDEPDLCELLALALERIGVPSRSVGDIATARDALAEESYALCLTDLKLPDGSGFELLEWVINEHPAVPCAVITAHGNVESAVRALKLGAFDFLSKPVNVADVRNLATRAMKLALVVDDDSPLGATKTLTGQSAAMTELRRLIHRVARSQAPVHIQGESGVGKELVARLIHTAGPRAENPFVAVNCGAIPTELMESELFGHKRGSFTGAVADHVGLIQAADGGTLFLDEIADLPLHMQVKLLRVIQEKTVRPIGEARETAIDVRILSATNRPLADLVAQHRFREDLYYRINVIELLVPPLRERLGDIEELATALLARLAARAGATPPRLTPDALQLLRGYQYPGNVRELENVLERAFALCADGQITQDDIVLRHGGGYTGEFRRPDLLNLTGEFRRPDTVNYSGEFLRPEGLDETVETLQREAILKALEQTRQNRTAAAKLLGISFRALRYRIKKLGLDDEPS